MEKVELPPDFDAEAYLRLNSDVRRSGMSAEAHYLKHGYKEGRPWRTDVPHFERDYSRMVASLRGQYPHAEAMRRAVGGLFEETGQEQVRFLEEVAGLRDGMSIVDLGCGSGRTAVQIAKRLPNCSYAGIDVVQDLLDHARSICPPNYRFIRSTEVSFPLPDVSADFIIAFSVFTHLLHEECYAYLQDALRVLRPGGKFVFSFFEFGCAEHWPLFAETVQSRKADAFGHMNTFIERSAIEVWSRHLPMAVERFVDGTVQALCVLRKL
jgi:ubiquinone/menaquinone biosynthesis C-methylase UbiE